MEKTSNTQDKIKQNNLESLRALNEALQTTMETNKELVHQTDQLNDIQDEVNETEQHLKRSNWLMRGVNSTFGALRNIFSSPPEIKKKKKNKNDPELLNEHQNIREKYSQPNYHQKKIPSQPKDDYDEIAHTAAMLKNEGLNMSTKIEQHVVMLDYIEQKMEKNLDNSNKINHQLKHALKN